MQSRSRTKILKIVLLDSTLKGALTALECLLHVLISLHCCLKATQLLNTPGLSLLEAQKAGPCTLCQKLFIELILKKLRDIVRHQLPSGHFYKHTGSKLLETINSRPFTLIELTKVATKLF